MWHKGLYVFQCKYDVVRRVRACVHECSYAESKLALTTFSEELAQRWVRHCVCLPFYINTHPHGIHARARVSARTSLPEVDVLFVSLWHHPRRLLNNSTHNNNHNSRNNTSRHNNNT